MTADGLIADLFVQHWLFTTIFIPGATFLYAFVTDQTEWCAWSGFLYVVYSVLTLLGRDKK